MVLSVFAISVGVVKKLITGLVKSDASTYIPKVSSTTTTHFFLSALDAVKTVFSTLIPYLANIDVTSTAGTVDIVLIGVVQIGVVPVSCGGGGGGGRYGG
jgi:hypothetical protein